MSDILEGKNLQEALKGAKFKMSARTAAWQLGKYGKEAAQKIKDMQLSPAEQTTLLKQMYANMIADLAGMDVATVIKAMNTDEKGADFKAATDGKSNYINYGATGLDANGNITRRTSISQSGDTLASIVHERAHDDGVHDEDIITDIEGVTFNSWQSELDWYGIGADTYDAKADAQWAEDNAAYLKTNTNEFNKINPSDLEFRQLHTKEHDLIRQISQDMDGEDGLSAGQWQQRLSRAALSQTSEYQNRYLGEVDSKALTVIRGYQKRSFVDEYGNTEQMFVGGKHYKDSGHYAGHMLKNADATQLMFGNWGDGRLRHLSEDTIVARAYLDAIGNDMTRNEPHAQQVALYNELRALNQSLSGEVARLDKAYFEKGKTRQERRQIMRELREAEGLLSSTQDRLREVRTAGIQAGALEWGIWNHDEAVYDLAIALGGINIAKTPGLRLSPGKGTRRSGNPAADKLTEALPFAYKPLTTVQGELAVMGPKGWVYSPSKATDSAGNPLYSNSGKMYSMAGDKPTVVPAGNKAGGKVPGNTSSINALNQKINNKVDIGNANFAQRDFRSKFSKKGRAELSRLTGLNIKTTDDLVSAIKSGAVDPRIIPVNVIVRDGRTLILNTRTANALQQAGVPRSSFNVINQTNNKAPVFGKTTFDDLLTDQLLRNNLSNSGVKKSAQQ